MVYVFETNKVSKLLFPWICHCVSYLANEDIVPTDRIFMSDQLADRITWQFTWYHVDAHHDDCTDPALVDYQDTESGSTSWFHVEFRQEPTFPPPSCRSDIYVCQTWIRIFQLQCQLCQSSFSWHHPQWSAWVSCWRTAGQCSLQGWLVQQQSSSRSKLGFWRTLHKWRGSDVGCFQLRGE